MVFFISPVFNVTDNHMLPLAKVIPNERAIFDVML